MGIVLLRLDLVLSKLDLVLSKFSLFTAEVSPFSSQSFSLVPQFTIKSTKKATVTLIVIVAFLKTRPKAYLLKKALIQMIWIVMLNVM